MPLVARVVVENAAQSFDKIYSYRVPEGMPVRPGCRVTAPFGAGNRTRFGLAVAVEEEPDAAGLKPLATPRRPRTAPVGQAAVARLLAAGQHLLHLFRRR